MGLCVPCRHQPSPPPRRAKKAPENLSRWVKTRDPILGIDRACINNSVEYGDADEQHRALRTFAKHLQESHEEVSYHRPQRKRGPRQTSQQSEARDGSVLGRMRKHTTNQHCLGYQRSDHRDVINYRYSNGICPEQRYLDDSYRKEAKERVERLVQHVHEDSPATRHEYTSYKERTESKHSSIY